MSKILIISDIHIHDYPSYNLFGDNEFRLKQFIKLAERVIEISIEQNFTKDDYLVISGDLIHRPIISSKVAHVVKEFIDILSIRFDKSHLLFIRGQHDTSSKDQNTTEKDSIINVILAHQATYVNKNILVIDDKTVAFADWQPVQCWDFINKPVDLLIGHVTLSSLFGQEYDNTKYKLGLFGDIHTPYSEGNSHTINIPIPHYLSDCQDGSVVIVDIPTMEWKRVKTESESFKYLKMYYDDSNNEDSEYTIKVKRPSSTVNTEFIHRSLDLEKVISDVVKSSNNEDLHSQVSTLVDKSGCDPLNINFKLNNIFIKNFRSISEYTFNLTSGITCITGSNGSGKSTLMRAIDFIVRPPRSITSLIKKGEEEMIVRADIDYDGRNHIIERGTKGTTYIINGIEVVANSVSDKNKIILDNLPFIEYFDIHYRRQNAPSFLSDYGYTERINLVNKLLGISLVEKYFEVANLKVKSIVKTISNLDSSISKQTGIVEANSDDFTIINNLESYNDLLLVNKEDQKINTFKLEINNKESKLLSDIKSNTNTRDAYIYDEVLSNTSTDEAKENILQGELIVSSILKEITSIKIEESSKLLDLNNLSKETLKLQNSKSSVKTSCPSCKRALDSSDYEEVLKHIDEEISRVTNDHNELSEFIIKFDYKLKIESLNLNYKEANTFLDVFKSNLSKITSENLKKSNFIKFDKIVNNLMLELDGLNISSDKLSNDEINLNLFNLKNQEIDLRNNITKIEILNDKKIKYNLALDELNNFTIELEYNKLSLSKYKEYSQLFHPTGSVIKSVYLRIAELLSDNNIIVRTIKELASGESRIDFDIDFKVGDYYIPYTECSGGQQVYIDMYFLSKLFTMSGQVGLIILDETLKDLDSNNLELVAKVIKSAPINSILLSTHMDSFNYYDNRLYAELIGNETKYTYEGGSN